MLEIFHHTLYYFYLHHSRQYISERTVTFHAQSPDSQKTSWKTDQESHCHVKYPHHASYLYRLIDWLISSLLALWLFDFLVSLIVCMIISSFVYLNKESSFAREFFLHLFISPFISFSFLAVSVHTKAHWHFVGKQIIFFANKRETFANYM